MKSKPLSVKNQACKWMLWGVPILFFIGCIMHFVCGWSGKSMILGVFSPINESVWEHLKLSLWPMFVWWIVGYLIYSKGNRAFAVRWFFSCMIAQLVCPMAIISFYYTYTGALGFDSLVLDILSLFLGLLAGQGLALYTFKYAKFKLWWLYIAILILALLFAAFIFFTFSPPDLPIFM